MASLANIGQPLIDSISVRPLPVGEYLQQNYYRLTPGTLETIRNISDALGVVLQRVKPNNLQPVAGCCLLARDLAIVNMHSFCEHIDFLFFPKVGYPQKGTVIFDGTKDSQITTDFKIVQLVNTHPISQHIPLSVCTQYLGEVLQFFLFQNTPYVKSCHTSESLFSQRSETISISTQPGDSGSVRFNVSSGAICSLHQGDSEGFTINQMIQSLRMAKCHARTTGQQLCQRLNIVDMQYLLIEGSPLTLSPGNVNSEVKVPACISLLHFLWNYGHISINFNVIKTSIPYLLMYLNDFGDPFIAKLVEKECKRVYLQDPRDLDDTWTQADLLINSGKLPKNPHFRGIPAYEGLFEFLYALCQRVSEGSLIDGIKQFIEPDFPVSQSFSFMAYKFEADHIVSHPSNTGFKDNTIAVANRRPNITQCTGISVRETKQLGTEIRSINFEQLYNKIASHIFNHFEDYPNGARVCFQTSNKYRITEVESPLGETPRVTQTTDSFIYTVEPQNGKYYMYHFEGSATNFSKKNHAAYQVDGLTCYIIPV